MPSAGISTALKRNAPRSSLYDLGTQGLDTNYSELSDGFTDPSITITVRSDGLISVVSSLLTANQFVLWNPAGEPSGVAGVGQHFDVKFTRSNEDFGYAGYSASASTGWQPVSTDRSVTLSLVEDFQYLGGYATCNYQIQLAGPGGFPIYETHTITLTVTLQ